MADTPKSRKELALLIEALDPWYEGEPILSALEAAGLAVVPVEPTKAQLEAGWEAADEAEDESRDTNGSYTICRPDKASMDAYRAMLTASPYASPDRPGEGKAPRE